MITRHNRAFTVVELMLVVVVIVILAAVTTVGYRGVEARAAETEIKNDATNIAEQIELAFVKAGKFPADKTAIGAINTGSDTTYTYTTTTTGSAFCIAVTSSKSGSKTYTVRDDKVIAEGTCSGWVPSSGSQQSAPLAPSPSIASITASSFSVSWSAVTGATSYTVRYGTSTPSTTASCSSSPCSISGLTSNTTYNVNVTATNSGGSTTSSQVSALTRLPAPTVSGVTYTVSTVKKADGYNYERYVVTVSGGTCSIGTSEWSTSVTGGSSPYWGSWIANNIQTHDVSHTGIYSAYDVTIYGKARCVSGSNTSVDSNTVQTFRGTGGGTGGSI